MNETEAITDHIVAVFPNHLEVQDAVVALSNAGFNMKHLSIVGHNYETEEHPIGFMRTEDRIYAWGKFGAFWGGIWGLLYGSAMLFFPGLGFVMFAGWIVSALEGALIGGGLGAIGAALAGLGIPEGSALDYEAELKSGSYLLLVHGTESELESAKGYLNGTDATRIDSYPAKI